MERERIHRHETNEKYGISRVDPMDVVLVSWPTDERRRRELAVHRRARLLLVDNDAPAPTVDDTLEDWVRLPAADHDIKARLDMLGRRVALGNGVPEIDEDNLLHHAGRWVSLPPVEARIAGALLDRFGAVVGRAALTEWAWPGQGPENRNALDVHLVRLRRRVGEVGLVIRTVRSRGYLLETR